MAISAPTKVYVYVFRVYALEFRVERGLGLESCLGLVYGCGARVGLRLGFMLTFRLNLWLAQDLGLMIWDFGFRAWGSEGGCENYS